MYVIIYNIGKKNILFFFLDFTFYYKEKIIEFVSINKSS